MPRGSNADIVAYTIGASDYLTWLKSANFNWDITLVECSGINQRHPAAVETKRALTFSAEHNRKANSAGTCQAAKTVTTLSFGGVSQLASWESFEVGYSNANSRSDAGGAALATVQLHRPTIVSGSINVMVDAGTSTWVTDLIDSGQSIDVAFSAIDGAGTFTCASHVKKVTKTWPEAGLIGMTLAFEYGTISSGGGGLFATGCTGSGEVAFTANDGADSVEGTMVVLNGRMRVARDGRAMESYDFHVNAVAVA